MYAGITAITELAVKSGLTNRLPRSEIIADNLSKAGWSWGLRLSRGLLLANVLFRFGAILLFPFVFLQLLLVLPLLGLPPRDDDEMVVFAVAPPGTQRHIPRLDKLPVRNVRRRLTR